MVGSDVVWYNETIKYMSEKIRNALGVAIIIAILLLGYAAVSYVGVYGKSIQPGSYRSFAASGEGKVVAVPDVAQFTFTVISEGGKDIAALQKENITKVNRAIDFVKAKGVDAKDIKTQSYNLSPRYENYSCPEPLPYVMGGSKSSAARSCPPPEIVGYSITQSVSVKVRDFSKIGDVLSGVVGSGANSVSQLYFTVDEPTELQNQARTQAIQKAQAEATSIARAAGFRLGKLISIEEGSGYPIYAYDKFGAAPLAAERGGGEIAPSIEPGSEEIKVNVTLRYEIE